MRKNLTLAAIIASGAIVPASAQLGNPIADEGPAPSCVATKTPDQMARLRPALRLALPWTEIEGEWRGSWTRTEPVGDVLLLADRGEPVHYRAVWGKGRERASADLAISIVGTQITIERTQPRGTCHYSGTLMNDWLARGTYRCSWDPAGQGGRWQATIGQGHDPVPCPDTSEPRYAVPWHEREGEWSSTWTPLGRGGEFRGHWFKRGEILDAPLKVSIQGTRVIAERTQPGGSCGYVGNLTGNGWTVEGNYSCSWNHTPMPWSATIGDGHP